jgi:hypothetical protein
VLAKAAIVILVLAHPPVAVQADYGIQQDQVAQEAAVVVVEIQVVTAADLEYQAVLL